jgi:DNA replication protein DnaC
MFGDQMVANATVDRLLHRGIVMAITGRSYRTQNINTNTNTTDELLPNKSFTNIKT